MCVAEVGSGPRRRTGRGCPARSGLALLPEVIEIGLGLLEDPAELVRVDLDLLRGHVGRRQGVRAGQPQVERQERVEAHLLVCLLAYVLWKTLTQECRRAGLGDEPRKVLNELKEIQLVDVVLPTKKGIELRRRCVSRPTRHQAILLQRLGLQLPSNLKMAEM